MYLIVFQGQMSFKVKVKYDVAWDATLYIVLV